MKPFNSGGHSAYQERVLSGLREYYPDAASSLSSSTWAILEKFWNLDLSELDLLMQDRYSSFGPPPRLPSDMLRSVLVSVEFKVTSYTRWAADLKENHLHAILSGFSVGDTPGVGTFYDFFSRLWLSDKNNLANPVHPPKAKPLKPDAKGEKAPPLEKITVKDLFAQFEKEAPHEMEPCNRLYEIFKVLFLKHSVGAGLVNLEALALAGDGTPVYTAAQERKKRTCSCLEQGIRDCGCDRVYRQPDCNIGWDSHRGRYYFGYGLYMLTASDSVNDLPIFPILGPASRHDSHGFLYNWFSMKQLLPEAVVTKLLLDSAHDAMPYYEYCEKHGIIPFIDLNGKGGRPPVYKDDFTINNDGVPVCKEGFAMRRDGTEPSKGRTKFKCPKITFSRGILPPGILPPGILPPGILPPGILPPGILPPSTPACTCGHPCSDAKYGRTVHLVLKDNPRLFNHPPRSSDEWKLEYNARTSAERCNKREKIDYKLEDGRYRSSKMWYCRLFAIMMCQHLDAWALPKASLLKELFRH